MGRAGSVGVPGKNIRMINGRRLVSYPLEAAASSGLVDHIYVSTDCPVIAETAGQYGAMVIWRPEELSRSDSEMAEVIMHAVDFMLSPQIVVTMHANCGTHRRGLIDECIERLQADESLDSCVSARVVEDMHPYRLKRVQADGTLGTWVDIPSAVASNRQAIADKAVVLDGACRAWRPDRCLPPAGQPPFRYLGNRIGWVENPGGFDVHNETDLLLTEHYHNNKPAWQYGA